MTTYLDCWQSVASALLSQALAGEPELAESLPQPISAGSFGFAASIAGEDAGCFSVFLEGTVLEASLAGEGVDQKAGWKEILREVADAASGELLARTGRKCKVESFEEIGSESKVSRAFQLQSGGRSWTILVRDEVRPPTPAPHPSASSAATEPSAPVSASAAPGMELLLDVELDASLRFGCREMPLGEVLALGPGDVVQLDRQVADPVDLLVGDKIVARGEVVLVNGNFGLRVTEVSSPRKRLESIRCLF